MEPINAWYLRTKENMITLFQLIHCGSGFILQTVKMPIDFTCNGWKCLELITVIKIH